MSLHKAQKFLTCILWGALIYSLANHLAMALHGKFHRDELQCLHAAWNVSRGLLPYRDFWENHTFLTYAVLQPFFWFLPENADFLIWVRVIYAFGASLVLLAVFYRLALIFFENRVFALLSTFILSASPVFTEWFIEIRPDPLLNIPWLLSWIVFFRAPLKPYTHYWGGLLLGVAWCASPKAAFFLVATVPIVLTYTGVKNGSALKKAFELFALSFVGFFTFPAFYILYYVARGALPDFMKWLFHFNFQVAAKSAYRPYFIIFGDEYLLYWPLCLLGVGLFLFSLYKKPTLTDLARKRLSILNAAVCLFAIYTWINPRPTGYTMMGFFPMVCLFITFIFYFFFNTAYARARAKHPLFWVICGIPIALLAFINLAYRSNSRGTWFSPDEIQNTQTKLLSALLKVTRETDPILDGYNSAVFRPQSYFFGNLVEIIIYEHQRKNFPPPGMPSFLESIETNQPAVILMDERLQRAMDVTSRARIPESYVQGPLVPKIGGWTEGITSIMGDAWWWPGTLLKKDHPGKEEFKWTTLVEGTYTSTPPMGTAFTLEVDGKKVGRTFELTQGQHRFAYSGNAPELIISMVPRGRKPHALLAHNPLTANTLLKSQ